MFEWAAPAFLWLLLLVLVLAWVLWRRRSHPRAALRFSDIRLFGQTPRGWAGRARNLLPVLRLLALTLIILALARPRFGTVERDVVQEGVDIFYCLDISGSMRAEDFRPNRLEKAKELTAEFAAKRPYDRQGIVLFSGEAFMLCPLTFDGNTVQEFLHSVTFDDVGVQGTAIGMGLARALKKLKDSQAKSKVIILMTDGENNAGLIKPEQAVEVAKKLGVKVYAIGVGSRGVTTVTVPTNRGPVRRRIQTNIDEELLQKIARETGGRYERATTALELKRIFREIDQLEKSEIEMKEYRFYDERMAPLLWAALALLLAEMLLAHTRLIKIP